MTKLVTVTARANNGHAGGHVDCTTVECTEWEDYKLSVIGVARHQNDGNIAAAQIGPYSVSLNVETAQAVVDQLQRFIDAQEQ